MTKFTDKYWMQKALVLAQLADKKDEVPIGAIVVKDNTIIGQGFNQPIGLYDPSAHAEIQALRDAAKHQQNYRLVNTCLYVTIEPCIMCVGAIVHSRIAKLYFGANEPKAGAIVSQTRQLDSQYINHHVEYSGGIYANECAALVKGFFYRRRRKKRHQNRNA